MLSPPCYLELCTLISCCVLSMLLNKLGLFHLQHSLIMAVKSWCLLLATVLSCKNGSMGLPPCDSRIYCTGELLEQVQMAKLFDDDKYFVDMKLKMSPDVVWEAFQNLTTSSSAGKLTKQQLYNFVQEYFEAPGQEFEAWTPDDWSDKPQILQRISNPDLRLWAEELHALWKSLGRKIKQDVQFHPELHSQIYVPNPLIVPGDRFREYYYWDSYWIIKGLLISEMNKTAKGMIENFLHLILRFGFIPNGGRVYYQRRSQPPFLTLMVESYILATNDTAFLEGCIDLLEKEYEFWMTNRSVSFDVEGKTHSLNRYNVGATGPRPESYSKDIELGQNLTEDARRQLWVELKTSAESGWDFSSRWFIDSNGENKGTLKDTQTTHIIPVDLNSILCKNEQILEQFHQQLGNSVKAKFYKEARSKRINAVHEVLWDKEQGIWFDFNLISRKKNDAFYASNMAPLWAECFEQESGQLTEMVIKYLEVNHLLWYRYGVPTSLIQSGEQWDYPNAWPPLQQIIIEGLAKSNSEKGKRIALEQAQNWIRSNRNLYKTHKAMFEKYNVNDDSKPAGGGEYEVQVGFGWTNGVALQLLDEYGDQLLSGAMELTGIPLYVILQISLLFFWFK